MRIAKPGALVIAVSLMLVAPTAALGAVREDSHLDSVGDVAYLLFEEGPGDSIPIVDPSRSIGDVRGLHAAHQATRVRVALYFRSLPRAGIKNEYEFNFKGPDNAYFRNLSIIAKPGNWTGYPFLRTFSGKRVTCSGLRYLIEYSHKRVVVDIPRSCLGNPEYVRVGAQSVFFTNDRVWLDDAQFDGHGYSGFGYGPPLHH